MLTRLRRESMAPGALDGGIRRKRLLLQPPTAAEL